MTDPQPVDPSSLPANVTIHGGSVTFNIYQAQTADKEGAGVPPSAQPDPVIILNPPDCVGFMISATGTGASLSTFGPFVKIYGKVVCASDTGSHPNPWASGGLPVEGSITGGGTNAWSLGPIPLPGGCGGNYRLHVWGLYQNNAVFKKAVQDFSCNSGSGGAAMMLGAAAGGAIKGAARLFRLRAEFPAGNPAPAGLPEGIDFGTPDDPPLLRFDETAGWILPTWNQVHPEPGSGQWQLRLLDQGSHHRGELTWQDTRVGVRTLGVWVAQPCSCLKKSRFVPHDSSASAPALPTLWLEPA